MYCISIYEMGDRASATLWDLSALSVLVWFLFLFAGFVPRWFFSWYKSIHVIIAFVIIIIVHTLHSVLCYAYDLKAKHWRFCSLNFRWNGEEWRKICVCVRLFKEQDRRHLQTIPVHLNHKTKLNTLIVYWDNNCTTINTNTTHTHIQCTT